MGNQFFIQGNNKILLGQDCSRCHDNYQWFLHNLTKMPYDEKSQKNEKSKSVFQK